MGIVKKVLKAVFSVTLFIAATHLQTTTVHAAAETTEVAADTITLVPVKGGCYKMGDAEDKSLHEVCVSDFSIGKYEVTQGQWQEIMGNNPSRFNSCGSDCPVDQVGWYDIQEFISKLNTKTGKNYRLPTEAEWEYAARSGGKPEKFSGGNTLDTLAWYDKNAGKQPHKVGTKQANGLGIHDMSGNVWEWVYDCFRADYYKKSPKNDPQGPNCSDKRVLRGGSWFNTAKDARAAFRMKDNPGYSYHFTFGFRLATSSKD